VKSGHTRKGDSFLSQRANWISSIRRNPTNFKNLVSILMNR